MTRPADQEVQVLANHAVAEQTSYIRRMDGPGNIGVCVVVPAHNENAAIGEVVTGLRQVFPHVICIDDGSTDSTGETARSAGATVLRHAINLGQGAALQTGFDYAMARPQFDHVVTFDGDGQHRVEDALAMVSMARARSLDVVLGSRCLGNTTAQPLARKLLLRAALTFSRCVTRLDLSDTHNGLRVLSRAALKEIHLTHPGMAYATELEVQIARAKLAWSECAVTIDYSNYSKAKGQNNFNAVNIIYDLAAGRLRGVA